MAARFHAAVGQPPMTYLSTWRLALAADRLASRTATTAVIAGEVGYSNAFTFSAAFSRVYGISHTGHRRTAHDPGTQDVGIEPPSTPATRSGIRSQYQIQRRKEGRRRRHG
jgi:AraC-like DNA-binding protein